VGGIKENTVTLEAAGVSDAEESAYRVLVTMGRASAHDFAVRSGLGITDSEQILTALTAKGLASHTDGIPRIYRATPPDVALMPRLKQQADALDHARATATGLLEIYRDTMRRSDADQLIEVITGADALRQHLQGAVRGHALGQQQRRVRRPGARCALSRPLREGVLRRRRGRGQRYRGSTGR
jgi:sugar-specific transcriptional regulator TrmB